MTNSLHRSVSRRYLIASAPLIAAGLWSRRLGSSSAAKIETTGDCTLNPALRHVYNFATSNFAALPLERLGSMDPGVDWEMNQTPELGLLFTPPDWEVSHAWANVFDRSGEPQWQGSPVPPPNWVITIVASPDDTAGYIFAKGALDNVSLSPADGAEMARRMVMGDSNRSERLCEALQTDAQYQLDTSYWITGDQFGKDLLLSRGTLLASSVGGFHFGPGTTFLFDAFVAPQDQSEDLVLDVYLKLLYQQLPKGGSMESTPTPTPAS